MSTSTQDTRITKLESAVTAVAGQLVDISRDLKSNQDMIWEAIKEQGKQHTQSIKDQGLQHSQAIKDQGLQHSQASKDQGAQLSEAVRTLSAKGQLSWGAIIATISMLVTLIGAGAGVGYMLMESRIRQVEDKGVYSERLNASEIKRIELRQDYVEKIQDLGKKRVD